MDISLYWWSPLRSARALVGEIRHASGAWISLAARRAGAFRNFGDEVSPLILAELSGRQFKWAPIARADVVGIGSLLSAYDRHRSSAMVFGSGIRVAGHSGLIDGRRVIGVRGHLTAAVSPGAPVIGDPGLAIPALMSEKRLRTRGVVLLPHFRAFGERSSRAELRRLQRLGYSIVEPSRAPLDVATAIKSADHVFTSSLHGLVFAHALGVPVQPIRFPLRISEPEFKYADYFSVFGLSPDFVDVHKLGAPRDSVRALDQAMQSDRAAVLRQLPAITDGLYVAGKSLSSRL